MGDPNDMDTYLIPSEAGLKEVEFDDVPTTLGGSRRASTRPGTRQGEGEVEGEGEGEEDDAPHLDEYLLLKLAKGGEWSSMFKYLPIVQMHDPALRTQDKNSGWTVLFYVVASSQVEIFFRLVESGADILHRAHDGRSICHVAAQFASYDMNVSVVNQFRPKQLMLPTHGLDLTPMHYACVRVGLGLDICRLYFRAGKQHRLTEDASGSIPLMIAAQVENLALCRELLMIYATDQVTAQNKLSGDTVLHIACRSRQMDLVRLFCDQGAPIDAQNNEGHTALHVAAWEGHEEIIRYFQQKGASAHIFDKMDRSALHIAAERGHTGVVEILIDRFHASIAARTKDGSTLLHISSHCGHPDTALMFLKKGVPLRMPNKVGSNCLHEAATQGHVAVVRSLCEAGAEANTTNKLGHTPLHLAVEGCKPMVVQTLLGFGADVQLAAGDSLQTPLHMAAKVMDGGERVAEMLVKSGADVNAQDSEGETPVHVAARCGNIKVLHCLLQEDTDPTIQSQSGETAVHIGVRYCQLEVVQRLLLYTVQEMTTQHAVDLVNCGNKEGESALHLAADLTSDCAHYNREEVKLMKLLLDYHADLFLESHVTKETPLHYCARGGNASTLSVVLEYLTAVSVHTYEQGEAANDVRKKSVNATQLRSLNIRNKAGWSPLMVASESGHGEVVEMLLNHNVRVDLFDEGGNTALHYACARGHTEIADELMWHKAFVNARTRLGVTPLHLSAQYGHARLSQLLINSHNATVDILSLTRKTPMHLAAQEGQIDVCQALLDLNADPFAKDMEEQTPLHLAAEKDFSEVVKLFLSYNQDLVNVCNSEGRTCAHIAASKGSMSVIKGLVKFNPEGLVLDKDSVSGNTTLHLAASGGFQDIVSLLLDNGANALEENDEGLTPLHLAAIFGHTNVLEVFKGAQVSLNYCSRESGLTAIHMAAHYGQTEFVQELLQDVGAQAASSPPAGLPPAYSIGHSDLGGGGNQGGGDGGLGGGAGMESEGIEYGFTPLHLAAESGWENLVRLLLNSPGVQPDVHTSLHGTTPLHLAAQAGHSNVIGLLLSKHEGLLSVYDGRDRSALHMAAANGHRDLCVLLVGQGADVNKKDVNGWTPLHFAAKAGHLDTVEALMENGASGLLETKDHKQPICYAAAQSHYEVLIYLLKREHNSHTLVKDSRFIFDMIQCSDSAEDPYKVVRYFILWSPAPLEIALKLSASYAEQSVQRKDRAKEFFLASSFCQTMGVDLTSVTTSIVDTEDVANSLDLHGSSLLDIMIECEQKEVVAHASVQKYLSDLWMGHYTVAPWMIFMLLVASLLPPVFFLLSLPIRRFTLNRIPLLKMLLYIISHLYFIALLSLTIAFKLDWRTTQDNLLIPRWNEWLLVLFICGLALSEILQPSSLNGLSSLKIVVILLGCISILIHAAAFAISDYEGQYDMIYIRNQVLGCVLLCCFAQLLDFLTFHHMFGPWAIIISDLMKDLFRFMILMGLFILGFTLQVSTIRQPAYPEDFCTSIGRHPLKNPSTGQNNTYYVGGRVVVEDFTRMAFTLFGLVDYAELIEETVCIPIWAETWSFYVYALYNVIALIVLINLLIAMMSDTYQRIEQQSDIEWKFGRAILIRTMSGKSPAAPPVNVLVAIFMLIYGLIKHRGKMCSVRELMRDDSAGARKGEESGWDKAEMGQGGDTATVVTAGSGTGGGAGALDQEVLSNHTNGSIKSRAVGAGGSVGRGTMGKKKHRGKRSSDDEHYKMAVRVENVVDWDVVMNMYKDMQHMDDDALEDNRHQTDHKNYDLGGSFSATRAIDNSFDIQLPTWKTAAAASSSEV